MRSNAKRTERQRELFAMDSSTSPAPMKAKKPMLNGRHSPRFMLLVMTKNRIIELYRGQISGRVSGAHDLILAIIGQAIHDLHVMEGESANCCRLRNSAEKFIGGELWSEMFDYIGINSEWAEKKLKMMDEAKDSLS